MIPITLHYGKDQTLLKLKLETVKQISDFQGWARKDK